MEIELSISGEESSTEFKARCLKIAIEKAVATFPNMKKHTFNVICTNDELNEAECPSNESILSVSDTGVLYWYHPYPEPGAPRFSSYKIESLHTFIEGPFKRLIVTNESPYNLGKESEVAPGIKSMSERLIELQSEEKRYLLEDIRTLLKGSINHLEFYEAVLNENIDLLKGFLDDGTVKTLGIEKDDIYECIKAIEEKNQDLLKSKRFSYTFRLLWSASKDKSESFDFDWQSQPHKDCSKRLRDYLEEFTPTAKEYYDVLVDDFSKSDLISRINKIVFS